MLNQEIFSTRLRELRKSKGQTLLQIAGAIASTKADCKPRKCYGKNLKPIYCHYFSSLEPKLLFLEVWA